MLWHSTARLSRPEGTIRGASRHQGEQGRTAKFVKSTLASLDPFAQRNLTLTGPATLLSVTPLALGAVAPVVFPSRSDGRPERQPLQVLQGEARRGLAQVRGPRARSRWS